MPKAPTYRATQQKIIPVHPKTNDFTHTIFKSTQPLHRDITPRVAAFAPIAPAGGASPVFKFHISRTNGLCCFLKDVIGLFSRNKMFCFPINFYVLFLWRFLLKLSNVELLTPTHTLLITRLCIKFFKNPENPPNCTNYEHFPLIYGD